MYRQKIIWVSKTHDKILWNFINKSHFIFTLLVIKDFQDCRSSCVGVYEFSLSDCYHSEMLLNKVKFETNLTDVKTHTHGGVPFL